MCVCVSLEGGQSRGEKKRILDGLWRDDCKDNEAKSGKKKEKCLYYLSDEENFLFKLFSFGLLVFPSGT